MDPNICRKPVMDTDDWRAKLTPDSRQKLESLVRLLPSSIPLNLDGLRSTAISFEETVYASAKSQKDYLRKMSTKIIKWANKSHALSSSLPSAFPDNSNRLPEPANQFQTHNQPPPQDIQNNMAGGDQDSSSGLTQNNTPSANGLDSSIQNISGISGSDMEGNMGMEIDSDMLSNSPKEILPLQQVPPSNQEHLIQTQLQQQIFEENQHVLSSLGPSLVDHEQSSLQFTQEEPQKSSAQTPSTMQPSLMQVAPISCIENNKQVFNQLLGKHPQSILMHQQQPQQAAGSHHYQTPHMQQQQLMSEQKNTLGSLQQQLNDLNRLQKQLIDLTRSNKQKSYMEHRNNMSNLHHQQLVPQTNVSGLHLQQQPLLGIQSSNLNVEANQKSLSILAQCNVHLEQQIQQSAPTSFPTQGKQSQQQQSVLHQSHPAHLQQQSDSQQLTNPLLDTQQWLQDSSVLFENQTVMDQKLQTDQSQGYNPGTSSTFVAPQDSKTKLGNEDASGWIEKTYQKILSLKDKYHTVVSEIRQKIVVKLQHLESLNQHEVSEHHEKHKNLLTLLDRILAFFSLTKSQVLPHYMERAHIFENQFLRLIPFNGTEKIQQQGKSCRELMQQPQSQTTQGQAQDYQLIPQLPAMNLQGSDPTMQQCSMTQQSESSSDGCLTSLQLNSNLGSEQRNAMILLEKFPLRSVQQTPESTQGQSRDNLVISPPPAMNLKGSDPTMQHCSMTQESVLPLDGCLTPLQRESSLGSEERNAMISLEKVLLGSVHQTSGSTHHKRNVNSFSSNMIHKHYPWTERQKQLIQAPRIRQQQLPAQLLRIQIPQLHQMDNVNGLKMRQGASVKLDKFQRNFSTGQGDPYLLQQLKAGAGLPVSSSQFLQAASPLVTQYSISEINEPYPLSSITKSGTPFLSKISPFVSPAASTSLPPMPWDFENPNHVTFTISNARTGGSLQTMGEQGLAQSFVINSSGVSASPPLEFTMPDEIAVPEKCSLTEKQQERLTGVVTSLSHKALGSSGSEIGSGVGMMERVEGSTPGNEPMAVGEDLVRKTIGSQPAEDYTINDGVTRPRVKKMKRYTAYSGAMAVYVGSPVDNESDGFRNFLGSDISDQDLTETSRVKKQRMEANQALLEEIRGINQQLRVTVITITNEKVSIGASAAEGDVEGVVIKCSSASTPSKDLKTQQTSGKISLIRSLRLLVPPSYPNSSPIILEKLPIEMSTKVEDMSVKAKLKFCVSLQSKPLPLSIKEIAKTWDDCVHAVMMEDPQQKIEAALSSGSWSWEQINEATSSSGFGTWGTPSFA